MRNELEQVIVAINENEQAQIDAYLEEITHLQEKLDAAESKLVALMARERKVLN